MYLHFCTCMLGLLLFCCSVHTRDISLCHGLLLILWKLDLPVDIMSETRITSWCHGPDQSYQLVSWGWPELPVGVVGHTRVTSWCHGADQNYHLVPWARPELPVGVMGLTRITTWCHGQGQSYQVVSWGWPELPLGAMGKVRVTRWCHGTDQNYQLLSWAWPELPSGVMGLTKVTSWCHRPDQSYQVVSWAVLQFVWVNKHVVYINSDECKVTLKQARTVSLWLGEITGYNITDRRDNWAQYSWQERSLGTI